MWVRTMKEKKYLKIPFGLIKWLFIILVIGGLIGSIYRITELNDMVCVSVNESDVSINDAYNKGYVDTINNVLNNIARTGSVVINLLDNTSVELVLRGD